ncbi:MAG: NADH-quinone oxidoreductase subunit C [Planctomycetes bacterium]|nr:NADH-quinone oxidoreductase subunit C [Planctomycetota bacterium]
MSATHERVEAALQGLEVRFHEARDGMTTLSAALDAIPAVAERLRDGAGFELCTLITAIDHYPAQPRFEMTWQLQSVTHGDRVRLHAFAAGEPASAPSVTHLWPGAAYYERECYDLMGVRFTAHHDFRGRESLRRILMPDAYEHHPLRKDFPHQGIEPDKLYRRWDAERRKATPST